MIYILSEEVIYGTAVTNRLLAYCRSFYYYGIESELIALKTFEPLNYEKELGFNVRGSFASKFKFKYIRAILSYWYALYFSLFKLKKDDVVLLYGCMNCMPIFVKFKKCKIFHERTEHPEIVKSKFLKTSSYINLCKKFDGLFVISRPLKKYYISEGIPEGKIKIINMIVDENRFDGVDVNISEEKYIAYCGYIYNDSKDGVLDLIKAFVKYHKSFPDRKLLIAGPIKSKKQKEIYENYVIDHGMDGYIVFLGLVSPNDMPVLLANAEMLMLTRPNNKQAHYGFPTKLGEYLLTKKPVIVSRVGDIDAFLTDGVNALLAIPEDIDDIVSKMLWVSEHPLEGTALGVKGYECARKNFNDKKETKKILDSFGGHC